LSRGPAGSGSSGTSALVSLRRLVSAGSALVALGPFLSALVTRTGWYSARPVARATGLAPRWSPLCALVAILSPMKRHPEATHLLYINLGRDLKAKRIILTVFFLVVTNFIIFTIISHIVIR